MLTRRFAIIPSIAGVIAITVVIIAAKTVGADVAFKAIVTIAKRLLRAAIVATMTSRQLAAITAALLQLLPIRLVFQS